MAAATLPPSLFQPAPAPAAPAASEGEGAGGGSDDEEAEEETVEEKLQRQVEEAKRQVRIAVNDKVAPLPPPPPLGVRRTHTQNTDHALHQIATAKAFHEQKGALRAAAEDAEQRVLEVQAEAAQAHKEAKAVEAERVALLHYSHNLEAEVAKVSDRASERV